MEFPFIEQAYQTLGNHFPDYIVQAIFTAIFFGLITLPTSIVVYCIKFHRRKMDRARKVLSDLETYYKKELSKIELENALLKIELLKRDNGIDHKPSSLEQGSEAP